MANEIEIIIFISLIILIFPNNTDTIIINPIRTKAKNNSLDFSISFNSHNAHIYGGGGKGQKIQIYEENNQIILDGKSYNFSSNIFLCEISNNNKILFAEYKLYSISKGGNDEIVPSIIDQSVPNDCIYFGYLILNGTLLLYGINKNTIFFYNTNNQNKYNYTFDYEIKKYLVNL